METWSELSEPNPTGLAIAAGSEITHNTGTTFQNMSGMGGVNGSTGASMEMMFVPLQFWFCRNPGLALPLIALQYHEVKFNITFGTELNIHSAANTNSIDNLKLYCDYIYLDTDERT